MKLILKTLLLLCIIPLLISCKSSHLNAYEKHKDDKNYIPGHIIDLKGNRTDGLVHYDGFLPSTDIIVFITEKGERNVYPVGALKSYGFSYRNFISDGNMFFEIVRDGKKAGLYKITNVKEKSAPRGGDYNSNGKYLRAGRIKPEDRDYYDVFYVKKSTDTSFKRFRKASFKHRFSKYFSDCDLIKTKIKKKEYTSRDFDEIVFVYNSNACD
jgi:hypothetical protein